MRHIIPRQGDDDLVVEGTILARRSGRRRKAATRWTEYRIIAVDGGGYVVEELGQSAVPGEVMLRTVTECSTPGEVREAVTRRGEGGVYLTHLGESVLQDAGFAATIVGREVVP